MWFVGFPTADSGAAPRGGWRWWRWFTRPGYRHVIAWCAADDEGGGTLFLDPIAGNLFLARFRQPVEQVTRHYIDHGYWTLAYAAPPFDTTRRPPLRPLLTCTEIVKAAIGLHDWRVITPRQLARALRRRGAVPVLPATSLPPTEETRP
jgi:hypothetical protein